MRVRALPLLAQPEYDHLLWSAELNFVRGEDSFVRALHLRDAPRPLAHELRALWLAWNGLAAWPAAGPDAWPDVADWRSLCMAWRKRLAARQDLTTELLRLAREKS